MSRISLLVLLTFVDHDKAEADCNCVVEFGLELHWKPAPYEVYYRFSMWTNKFCLRYYL